MELEIGKSPALRAGLFSFAQRQHGSAQAAALSNG
jgi:hypothetical protein